jgi:hypothetical protein
LLNSAKKDHWKPLVSVSGNFAKFGGLTASEFSACSGVPAPMPARLFSVLMLALTLAACANPYVRSPEAGISTALAYRAPKPSKLVKGNYCGVGSRTGDLSAKPVDRLDAACLEHDACYIEGRSQIECNRIMIATLRGVVADPASSAKMRAQARSMTAFLSLPFFKVFPHGILPPRDPKVLASRYRGGGIEQDGAKGLF